MTPIVLIGMTVAMAAQQAVPPPTPEMIEQNSLKQLLSVRRIYVDHLTGGETAAQMRDILISSLAEAKIFVLTENPEHADAVMRGAAEDLVFTDVHSSADGINARATISNRATSSSRGQYAGVGLGENESDHSAERRHEAIAAVRLVNKDGDVIWSTTEESQGARFHGASADVADKITAKLKADFDKARNVGQASRPVQ